MNNTNIKDLIIPTALLNSKSNDNEEESLKWENELVHFFSSNYKLFTPFPDYFKIRYFEFKLMRQLLNEYIGFEQKFEKGLEIGCGFGFKSALLSKICTSFEGIDIPIKYEGYVQGDFKNSVEIAQLIVNEKLNLNNVTFKTAWPDNLEPIANNSISLLFSEYCLEHIPDLKKAIFEMYRVMEKGGTMIHVVPNTNDAVIQFIKEQVNISIFGYLKIIASKFFKKSNAKIKINGIIIPSCHSEFINDFNKQIDIYSLENFLFPIIEAGFKIDKIISTREYNNVIIAKK